MSRERRRTRYANYEPYIPDVPDWTDDVAAVVQNHEADFLQRLEIAHARNKTWGLYAQAEIIARIHIEELDRLDPEGKLSFENGDSLKKGRIVNWGDL